MQTQVADDDGNPDLDIARARAQHGTHDPAALDAEARGFAARQPLTAARTHEVRHALPQLQIAAFDAAEAQRRDVAREVECIPPPEASSLKFPHPEPEFSCSINHLRWNPGLGF